MAVTVRASKGPVLGSNCRATANSLGEFGGLAVSEECAWDLGLHGIKELAMALDTAGLDNIGKLACR